MKRRDCNRYFNRIELYVIFIVVDVFFVFLFISSLFTSHKIILNANQMEQPKHRTQRWVKENAENGKKRETKRKNNIKNENLQFIALIWANPFLMFWTFVRFHFLYISSTFFHTLLLFVKCSNWHKGTV